jgi:CheY-like chemotaxis protein
MADVLVVDDDQVLLDAMGEILAAYGHRVCTAISAMEALRAIEESPPDLIVADVIMPGMSGIDLMEAVRARPDWSHIPFLFISAAALPETRRQIEAMEGGTFLAKPFNAEDLNEAVATKLGS